MLSPAIDDATAKTFVSEPKQAHVGLPEYNPLLARVNLTIQREGEVWAFYQPKPFSIVDGQHRRNAAANFIYWQQRDAERRPLNSRVHFNLALAYENAGRYEEAEEELRRALELSSDDRNALLCLSRVKIARGDLDGAAEVCDKIISKHPDDSTGVLALAQIHIRKRNLERASTLLKAIREEDPNAPVALLHLGIVQLLTKDYPGAIASFRRAGSRIRPSAEFYNLLGIAQFFNDQLRRSERTLRTSIRLSANSETPVWLAHILLETGHVDDAKRMLVEYTAKAGGIFTAFELLARAYELENNYKRAGRELERAFRISEEASAQASDRARIANNIGVCAERVGKTIGDAESWFKRSIDLCPNGSVVPWDNLVKVCVRTGRLKTAGELVSRARDLFPESRSTRVLSAVCLGESGYYKDAVIELAQELDREDCLGDAYVAAGNYLCEQGAYERGLVVLQRGAERYPENDYIKNNLAYAHLMLGQVEAARAILSTLTGLEGNPQAVATRGLLRLWDGDVAAARRFYRRAAGMAAGMGNKYLSRSVKQKLHLELARHFLRVGKGSQANREIEDGLSIEGRLSFMRELNKLKEALPKPL